MRVFVLTTGRAASKTFAKACGHIKGMTAAHESRSQLLTDRLVYPDRHVEVDNRLVWFLGSLDRLYDDVDTHYVFLKRDRAKVSESYLRRWFVRQSLVRGFYHSILMRKGDPSLDERAIACRLCVETIEDNIAFFLRGRHNASVVNVETLKADFSAFVERAGLECDLQRALAEFDVTTNLNKESAGRRRSLGRSLQKLMRAVRNFPDYFREV